MTDPSSPVYFNAILYPNRSLGRRAFLIVMAIVGGTSFVAGLIFYTMGAWPVAGFYGLDLLLIYIAFKMSYRQGRMREKITLTEETLEILRILPGGQEKRWTFQPAWVRVAMDDPPEHDSMLTIGSHGRTIIVGAFLAPEERLDLARALQAALDAHRKGVPPSPGPDYPPAESDNTSAME